MINAYPVSVQHLSGALLVIGPVPACWYLQVKNTKVGRIDA
jgi:hypothetical protein